MKTIAWGAVAAVAAMALVPAPAFADFPEETIHIVVPYPAGGGTDSIGRGLAKAIEDTSDASVVVDNITGGVGVTGSVQVAKGRPDGYTLLLTGSTDLGGLMVFRNTPFDLDSFAYVGGVYSTPTWVLSNEASGFTDFQQVLDQAQAEPDTLTLGIGGKGGAHHVMAEAIVAGADAPMRIISYDGGAALKKAIIANEVDVGVIHSPVLLAEVEQGLVNVLATGYSLENIVYEAVHDTPTLAEFGIDAEIGVTRAVMAPAETPEEVLSALQEMVQTAATSDSFKEFGQNFGFAPVWIPGPEFEKQLADEVSLFEDIKENVIDKQGS